ncbi:MAG: hypothetical protein JXB30_11445 [Anaerolineae bacterium]|nr:hypothetical protein [Anaerolineae bacterium]
MSITGHECLTSGSEYGPRRVDDPDDIYIKDGRNHFLDRSNFLEAAIAVVW